MSTPLNDTVVPSQATRRSDQSAAPDTRLHGRSLILARVIWGAAVTLIVVATVTLHGDAALAMNSAWLMLHFVLFVFGSSLYVQVLAFFPDGRFVPRWMRWLLPCWAVAALLSFMYTMVYTLVWYAALVLLMISQVYRRRT